LFAAVAGRGVWAADPRAGAPPAIADLARRADEAREKGRLEEAAELYREGLRRQPRWTAGLWFLGTIAYERDRFTECREAFSRLTAITATAGPAWALRGLCEFGASNFDSARSSIDRALRLGGIADEDLLRVVLYHQALLRIRASEFEMAIPPLTQVVTGRPTTPEAAAACGLVLLRRPQLPAELPASDIPLVRGAGEAYCAALGRRGDEARALYERLIASHPDQEHLHYGLGLVLAQQGAPGAADAFRRETERHPKHVLAHLELAFELVRRGEPQPALPAAETAARLAPGLFATRLALGRVFVELGDLPRGIAELEAAARIAPGVREIQWALANAYTRAGRKADAERARAAVQRIDADRRLLDTDSSAASGARP
jgi:tetratricopeptide (TPR) repeat protein